MADPIDSDYHGNAEPGSGCDDSLEQTDSTCQSEQATLDAVHELERALWASKEKNYGNAEVYAGQAATAFARARKFRELGM